MSFTEMSSNEIPEIGSIWQCDKQKHHLVHVVGVIDETDKIEVECINKDTCCGRSDVECSIIFPLTYTQIAGAKADQIDHN